MATTPFWNRSTFAVITGASRGIGRCLAIKFSSLVAPNSTLVLLARSSPDLEDTRKQILAANPSIDVKVHSVDLGKPSSQAFEALLTSSSAGKQYDLHLLVHNAGTLLTNVRAAKMDDIEQFNQYMTVNLYSVTALTASFLKLFTQGERCIVNITSLYGIQPGKGLVHYCVGKASREMYFKVLATENPELNILNYSPGPIDTSMYRQIADDCWAEEARNMSKALLENKTTVKMEDSVQKLADTLKNRSYSSGGRIDYFDRV